MARKPRIEFAGAFSHVNARGNRRALIFHDDADYRAYLDRWERYRQRDGVLVPARAMLVYLAREWSHLTVRELSRRVQRDTKAEVRVRYALGCPHNKSIVMPDPFCSAGGCPSLQMVMGSAMVDPFCLREWTRSSSR
jgi:hypothetical protein